MKIIVLSLTLNDLSAQDKLHKQAADEAATAVSV